MIKRKWDIGSPCLGPLDALTQPFGFSFIRIAKVIDDKQPLIQVLYLGLNPFLSNTWFRKPQLT